MAGRASFKNLSGWQMGQWQPRRPTRCESGQSCCADQRPSGSTHPARACLREGAPGIIVERRVRREEGHGRGILECPNPPAAAARFLS